MGKFKEFLKNFFIVVGGIMTLSALIVPDLAAGDRVLYVFLGVGLAIFAVFPVIRNAVAATLFFFLTLASLLGIVGPDGTPDLTMLIPAGAFLAIGILFTRRLVRSSHRNNNSAQTVVAPGDIVINSTSNLQGFLATHTLVDTIFTKVVGVTYKNDDGSSRQRILASCHIGDEIALRPFTYRGAPAYAVWSPHGQIGNLSADLARDIDANFGDCITQCTIATVTGGTDGLYYGCNLIIKVYKENEYAKPPWRSTVWQATANTQKPSGEQVRNTYKLPDDQTSNAWIPPAEQASNAPPEPFIAEAQWYAARGGVDLKEDE